MPYVFVEFYYVHPEIDRALCSQLERHFPTGFDKGITSGGGYFFPGHCGTVTWRVSNLSEAIALIPQVFGFDSRFQAVNVEHFSGDPILTPHEDSAIERLQNSEARRQ
jgi:hypothetical protein